MTTPAIVPQSRAERRIASPKPPPNEWLSAPGYTGSAANPDRRQIVRAIEARIAGFEARVEQATSEFETDALARLQQSFGETIRQAQERMKHYANACGESRLVSLETELEQRIARS